MASSSKLMTLDMDNNIGPTGAVLGEIEMVIDRAHSEPWESNTQSYNCGLGEISHLSSASRNENKDGNALEDHQ